MYMFLIAVQLQETVTDIWIQEYAHVCQGIAISFVKGKIWVIEHNYLKRQLKTTDNINYNVRLETIN